MATSGSINYSVSRDDIITEALEQLSVIGEGESPSTAQLTSLGRTLNMMVKAWQGDGLNLFALQRVYVFLQKDTHEYSLDNSIGHLTTSFTRTTTSSSAVSGASTIEVTSAAGIADTYYIGIELDSGSLQWTTVSGAPAGTTVTLTDTLTGDVSSGATVYVYQTKASRPMKIMNAIIRDGVNNTDIEIDIVSRQEYIAMPNKTSDGQVNMVYYDPQVGTGKLYTWPETNSVDDYLVLWVQRTLEDFDASIDEPDFPQEWFLPLAYNLAKYALPKYPLPTAHTNLIVTLADDLLMRAQSFDSDDGFQLQPSNGYD